MTIKSGFRMNFLTPPNDRLTKTGKALKKYSFFYKTSKIEDISGLLCKKNCTLSERIAPESRLKILVL